MASNTYLEVGDQITAEIDGLGRLLIDVYPDPDAAAVVPLKETVG